MNDKIIDIIPPYEEEFLYGWVVRMLNMYLNNNVVPIGVVSTMKNFFGDDVRYPGLYFQNGLHHFVEKCDLPEESILADAVKIVEKMTILPFYLSFRSKEEQIFFYENLRNGNNYGRIEEKLGIDLKKHRIEGTRYIKICPKCIEENGYAYLRREHQVPGNFFCEIHKTELVLCVYNKYRLEFGASYKDLDTRTWEMSQDERKRSLKISEMIHKIFCNGFLNEVCEMKQKFRSKLRSLAYMKDDFSMPDYDVFFKDLGMDTYFRFVNKKDILFNVIYDWKVNVNPIFYLVLIEFLFGSLESFYKYQIEFPSGKTRKTNKSKEYSCEHYAKIMGKRYLQEYTILGHIKGYVIVRHKTCGLCFKNDNKMKKLRRCPYYDVHREMSGKFTVSKDEEGADKRYKSYISTVEYAEKHKKERKQIYNYCISGRIEGAIQIGAKDWFVPENAEYPVDKRYRKKRIE